MKKIFLTVLTILILGSSVNAVKQEYEYPKEINVGHALLRGVVNSFTFWLEVPRNMVLEINKYPFIGFCSGPLQGLYFSSARFCLSFADLVMLGTTGPSAYTPVIFPEYVWNAKWNPYGPINMTPIQVEMERGYETREAIDDSMDQPY